VPKLPKLPLLFLVGALTAVLFAYKATTSIFARNYSACDVDFDRDGIVDVSDYSFFTRNFLKVKSQKDADINKDGYVDLADYSILVSNFMKRC